MKYWDTWILASPSRSFELPNVH